MRGLSTRHAAIAVVVALGLGGAACDGGGPSTTDGVERAYLRDAASRRAALVASLVNPANSYSTLRLAHYASGDDGDWDRLPAWNPRVAPVALDALAATAPPALPAEALTVPDEATWEPGTATSAALEALGEEAFFRYPAQLAPAASAPPSRADAARYGWWLDDARGVGGLVWTETDAGTELAYSCATCHADVVDGRLVAGVPSHFDYGQSLVDAGNVGDPTIAARLLAWGPGRVDVTTDDASVPERIGDVRPARWLTFLQYDATVRQLDVVSLAIRIETLIITSHGQANRPPRLVALALASYLWSLGATAATPDATSAGGAIFSARCAGCHAGAGFTGAPRPLDEVGTDPTLGLSPARGTGMYRVPSLRGVSARPSLLHDGTLPTLDALFDPGRLGDDYTGGARGAGPVRGHVFGLDLPATDRAELVVYLRSL